MIPPRTRTGRVLILVLLAVTFGTGPLLMAARQARATATFSVNVTGDAADITPTDGVCDASGGAGSQCTVRAAIQQANASQGDGDGEVGGQGHGASPAARTRRVTSAPAPS